MAAFVVSSFASVPTANADIIWTFRDVTFDDGTKLTGTFTVAVNGAVSAWDVSSVDGALTGYQYTPVINAGGTFPISNYVVFNRPGYNGYLDIVFLGPLTVPGFNPIVTNGASYECGGYASQLGACTSLSIRHVSGGVASSVPEPSTWAMLIAGFAGIGVLAWRCSSRVARSTP